MMSLLEHVSMTSPPNRTVREQIQHILDELKTIFRSNVDRRKRNDLVEQERRIGPRRRTDMIG